MNNNLSNKAGCCGSVHGKCFEILLIIIFILGATILIVNLILTNWQFKLSYYLYIIEIILIAFNGLCLIFTIILRYWRSNGSVLNTNYSSSNCLSIFIIILLIINLLGSIAEEILFYFVYYLYAFEGPPNDTYAKMFEIYLNIMNNPEKNRLLSDDDDDNMETKIKILKILPWISFSFNALIQIFGIIFIALIRKRIKLKSDFGIPGDVSSTINGNSVQVGNASDINVVKLKDNNEHLNEKGEVKKEIKNGELFPNEDSSKREINKKPKKKKKKKRKSKSKIINKNE